MTAPGRRPCRWLPMALMLALSHAAPARAEPLPAPAPSAPAPADILAHAPTYPATRRLDLVEDHFGVKVADPYRWLEGDVRSDADVRRWVEMQNAATQDYVSRLPGRDILKRRMAALFDYGRFGVPRKAGGRYFYTYNSGLQNQSPLYVREGLHGAQRELIDPNGWAKDGATALAEWQPSPDGTRLLYAVQDGGSDWRTLRVLDVASGRDLSDSIAWVKYSQLAWDGAGAGFYYSRFAAPGEGDRLRARSENQQVYYHRLGTPQDEDRLIYATPSRPKLGHSARVSDDGRWLIITSAQSTEARNEITVADLSAPKLKLRTLVRGLDNDWRYIGNIGPMLYFLTDMGAPRYRVVLLDARNPRQAPVEVVAQRAETLAGGSMVGQRMVLASWVKAGTVAEIVDLAGRRLAEVPLPGVGAAAGFAGRSGDPETFFSFSGYTRPATIYRFDTGTLQTEIFAEPNFAFDPDNFVTQQIFYPSKDGTSIPMYVIRRRDIAEAHRAAPTLLYGYGGFNIAQTPGFSATRMAWLEQGGVLAIASLRGGSEYGAAWHDAGRLLNKQNVFDDFIAAGEFLKANGYTTPGGLAIEGRSNGGLLVGAVVNQRPDLFAAAIPAVGVMDMLRFDQFTAGRYWVDDYDHPDREADFRNLLGYSPYHNIRPGLAYPAVLVTTADSDDRVVPGHSFKYAAALQAAQIGDRPHLIRIETRAGHGAGKPVDKLIDEYADTYAFAAYWTGLSIGDPAKPR